MTAQANTISESIYHVMLMVSPPKASRGQIEKIRVLGTYTSIGKAKDAAHRGLFDKNVTYSVLRKCQIEQGIFSWPFLLFKAEFKRGLLNLQNLETKQKKICVVFVLSKL
jgi:hypothetical protein